MRAGPGRRGLVAILAGAGVTHLITPRVYDGVVPGWVPGPARWWTYASGAAELVVAGLLAGRRTRRVGGRAAAALFVAVYPANIQMTVDAVRRWRQAPGDPRRRLVLAATVARLPLQWPLVASSAAVARGRDERGAPVEKDYTG